MGFARDWLRRHPVAGFLVFSHGWTFLLWTAASLMALYNQSTIWDFPAAPIFYAGGAGVFIGGFFMTAAVGGGKKDLTDLARRSIDPSPIGVVAWATILLLYPLLTVLAAAMASLAGLDADMAALIEISERVVDLAAFIPFLMFILIIGPLPEEIGWRGYLLDRLLRRMSALAATALVTLVWWSWHLPLPYLPGYFSAFDRQPPGAFWMLVYLMPTAVLHTWVFIRTNRSVLAVILLHLIGNLTGQLLLPSEDARSVRLVLEFAAAAAIVASWLRLASQESDQAT